jgi:hypothetical protein
VVSIPASCFRSGGLHAQSQTNYSLCWDSFLNKMNRPHLLPSSSFPDHRSQTLYCFMLCRVSGDFVSIFQDLIPEVIPSQKCHMNMGPILSGYGGIGVWNVVWLVQVIYSKKDSIVQYSTLKKWEKRLHHRVQYFIHWTKWKRLNCSTVHWTNWEERLHCTEMAAISLDAHPDSFD